MKNTFSNEIEAKFENLTELQKSEYLKKYNLQNKISFVASIIGIVIIITMIALITYFCSKDNSLGLLVFFIVVMLICLLLCLGILISSIKSLKLDDNIKIKKHIEILENRKANKTISNQKQNPFLAKYDTSNIKSVILLDTYTEVSDKLHAVLNFQEIIQTRYYKFRVNYVNGKYEIINAKEGSPEYNALIGFVGSENNSVSDNVELIKKYKQLLDDGVITQEEFEQKKKELL